MRKTVKKSLYLCSHHDLVFMLLWQQLLWGLQSAWQQTSQWRIIWDHLRRTWPRWRTDLVPSWTPSSNPSVHRFGHTEQQFDHVLFITFYKSGFYLTSGIPITPLKATLFFFTAAVTSSRELKIGWDQILSITWLKLAQYSTVMNITNLLAPLFTSEK